MRAGPPGKPVEGGFPARRRRQPRARALEAAKRRGAERYEDPRSDSLNLALEVRPTRFHLVSLRRPVRGGWTFDQVRDEDFLPRESAGGVCLRYYRPGGLHTRSARRCSFLY